MGTTGSKHHSISDRLSAAVAASAISHAPLAGATRSTHMLHGAGAGGSAAAGAGAGGGGGAASGAPPSSVSAAAAAAAAAATAGSGSGAPLAAPPPPSSEGGGGAPGASSSGEAAAVPTVFRWEHGGNNVFITGTFNNWSRRVQMHRSGNDFVYIVSLPKAKHAYKFIVDDEWRFAPDQLTVHDMAGNINNYVDLTTFTAEDDTAELPSRTLSLPGAEYGLRQPEEDEFSKEPPLLPPQLRNIILNAPSPHATDQLQLSAPQHVTLNHLYCTAIKDGIMVQSLTQRYRRKFVSTVYYAAMPVSMLVLGPEAAHAPLAVTALPAGMGTPSEMATRLAATIDAAAQATAAQAAGGGGGGGGGGSGGGTVAAAGGPAAAQLAARAHTGAGAVAAAVTRGADAGVALPPPPHPRASLCRAAAAGGEAAADEGARAASRAHAAAAAHAAVQLARQCECAALQSGADGAAPPPPPWRLALEAATEAAAVAAHTARTPPTPPSPSCRSTLAARGVAGSRALAAAAAAASSATLGGEEAEGGALPPAQPPTRTLSLYHAAAHAWAAADCSSGGGGGACGGGGGEQCAPLPPPPLPLREDGFHAPDAPRAPPRSPRTATAAGSVWEEDVCSVCSGGSGDSEDSGGWGTELPPSLLRLMAAARAADAERQADDTHDEPLLTLLHV